MKKVIFGIGVPGSGKSTILRKIAQDYDYEYINPDSIRAELTGDASDQSKNAEVWELAYKRTAQALDNGKTVVFDATFAKSNNRQQLITLARNHGVDKIQAIFTDIDLDIAKERNEGRERVVPGQVIDRMYQDLRDEVPSTEEGIDAIFSIDEFQKIQSVERAIEEGSTNAELRW